MVGTSPSSNVFEAYNSCNVDVDENIHEGIAPFIFVLLITKCWILSLVRSHMPSAKFPLSSGLESTRSSFKRGTVNAISSAAEPKSPDKLFVPKYNCSN